MSQAIYRRRAILARIHKALDAFYLLQRIDWEYDIRETLERIMKLALEEIEFDGGKIIERALVIVRTEGDEFEAKAGYRVDDLELGFSRTVVQETMDRGRPLLCENAVDDPRFMEAESIKGLNTLSLICVPFLLDERPIGAFYVESKTSGRIFESEDLDFLAEFAETAAPYLKTALTHQGHVQEIRKLQAEVRGRYGLDSIIGRSAAIRSVFELIRIAANVDRTVLITGESGCGKELVAKAIHHNGHRREGRLVIVDCSSLAEHLLESELFGHTKGAFTGASSDKVGAFEEADGGTIFLDEINDASKPMQQKLRRVLQEGEIRRVGDNAVRRVDVRVICATNRNLAELVERGEFIRDLFYRINKFPIQIPPLRERREDIPLLARRFLELHAEANESLPLELSSDAVELLVARDWTENNIRELRNTIDLAADFASGERIDRALLDRILHIQNPDSLPPGRSAAAAGDGSAAGSPGAARGVVRVDKESVRALLDRFEARDDDAPVPKTETPFYRLSLEFSARVIIEGLRATDWKLRPAARLLGISPMKLRGELKDWIRSILEANGGDLESAASATDVPLEILEKKIADLGLEEHAQVPQERETPSP